MAATSQDGEAARVLISNTFLEIVQGMPAVKRSYSWPQTAEKGEEVYLEGWSFTHPKLVSTYQVHELQSKQSTKQSDLNVHWHEEYGLHADHPSWQLAPKLMIRNLPARCTHAELEAFVRSSTACKFQLSLPLNQSGRNRGYAFITVPDIASLRSLVRAMWGQRVPTRQSERPVMLQPGN